MAKVRNIIIGYDGTWNDTKTSAVTNVVKLLKACAAKDQVTHYEEGVGTAHWEALPGGIVGAGLTRQILDAYRFLIKRFADTEWPIENNKVFVFGFSRGAYAARRLGGLIAHSGVPKNEADVELAWQLYIKRDSQNSDELKKSGRFFEITIEMMGVWDTVKTTTDEDFNDFNLPKCVVAGCHAMAIDEKRLFFPVLKWKAEERVKQIWFSGVHADVGGGYRECGLSDITLHWMIDKACERGLRIKASAVNNLKKDPCGMLHNSYDGIWQAFGERLRSIDNFETVHASTKERIDKITDYRPINLPMNPNYET